MRIRSIFITAFLALVVMITSSQFLSVPEVVTAETLMQEAADFTGARIYFTEQNNEASRFDRSPSGVSRYAGILESLGATVGTLEWRRGIPDDADLIVIVSPSGGLSSDQVARLWTYLEMGGRILLFAEPLVNNGSFRAQEGFFGLTWTDIGLRGREDLVLTQDEAGGEGEEAALTMNFMTDSINDEHPITANFTGTLAFFGARSLEINPSFQPLQIVPLVFSHESAYGEVDYGFFLQEGILEYNIGRDTGQDALPLIAVYEDDTSTARIVVIGDREFVTNGSGFQTSPSYSNALVFPDNARFLLNASTWLVDAAPVELSFPTAAPTGTATITPTPTSTPTPEPTQTPTATS